MLRSYLFQAEIGIDFEGSVRYQGNTFPYKKERQFSMRHNAHVLLKVWKLDHIPPLRKQGRFLQIGIRALEDSRSRLKPKANVLLEQPFDLHLLNWSDLYGRSRKLFRQLGGRFCPTYLSSRRSLSSPVLLEPIIQYSPMEREWVWLATDQVESKNPSQLLTFRSISTSIYHEQNHRILWKVLPPAPRRGLSLRRFLNFSEAIIITLDMALSDELGPRLATLFYLLGVTYDPGTLIKEHLSARDYRNYLQAVTYATYLNLECYSFEDIRSILRQLFPQLGSHLERTLSRSLRLDRQFIEVTNPVWQKRYASAAGKLLSDAHLKPLVLSDNPLENWVSYLIVEHVFDHYGIKK